MIPPRLRAVLESPPRGFSPAAIWWWSGAALTRARLRFQLERFAAGGVYNLVVLNLAPSGPMFGCDADIPAFFSEEWWELLDGVCSDAAELGVSLWFYDQLGFSGADLQARLVRDVPSYAGQWLEPSGEVTRRGFDYLSVEACAALIDRVHGEFERRLGHRLGNVIVGSFQDELPTLPTWSERFALEFRTRRGYDLAPHQARLWSSDGADTDAYQIRRDYQLTRAELAEEAFFRPLAAWHERHGLLHGCDQQDPARAGRPVDGVRLYADYARTHRWFGAPGSDHHGDARIHSSLAHLYGRPRTWIEAFHSTGWGGTLEETFDWLLPWLRAGATLYNPHAVYTTTKAGWWEWAPPSTDWRQPYWRHHKVFADAVTRLCAALSLGRHLCDVAVLLPTTTAQAFTCLDGVDPPAEKAQQVYRDLVGDMAWFEMTPGVLDRLCIDADVIDDASVQRATVSAGRLNVCAPQSDHVSESYAAIVLPACMVLEEATVRRLIDFAASGGRVIAVGASPELVIGKATQMLARLREVIETASTPDDLGPLLAGLGRVEAPVPALVREVDDATLVFLTGTFPMASQVTVGRPEERGADLGWIDVEYDFDPARYAREMTVRVRGVHGPAYLITPFTSTPRVLPTRAVAPLDAEVSAVEVVVPFDAGPAAILVFPSAELGESTVPSEREPVRTRGETREASSADGQGIELGRVWEMELVPTLDNSWGDFARPVGEMAALERWELSHRVEGGDWALAHATFGPHGVWTGPAKAGELPGPGEDHNEWRMAVYSSSRGIHKDPIHRETLGPKGHVPEEFLDFGEVAAGEAVHFRAELIVPAEGGYPAVGAAAAKRMWIDGEEIAFDDENGYLAIAEDRLTAGRHVLDLRLTLEERLRLRAHIAVVTDPARYRRPEWITVAGPVLPGGEIVLSTTLHEHPADTRLQVASAAPCRVLVNGVEIGRQGGFDPYAEQAVPRVGRYDAAPMLRPGDNKIALHLVAGAEPPAVLVDGCAVSARDWQATHDGVPTQVVARRRQHGDPGALHLTRRPHPLPEASWLEDTPASGVVLPVVFSVPGPHPQSHKEWLRFDIPPGATRMEFTAHGEVTVYIDGEEHTAESGCRIDLPGQAGVREALLRIRTREGHLGGAALAGPIRFEVGTGQIELGNWEDTGLTGYSGGVRYRRHIELTRALNQAPTRRDEVSGGNGEASFHGDEVLDLGWVRGSAEVVVNGRPVGVRVCAPYVFAVGEALREGRNEIEVLVFGTLGPYLDAVSPTHFVFPGQRVSGLGGPVRIVRSTLRRG